MLLHLREVHLQYKHGCHYFYHIDKIIMFILALSSLLELLLLLDVPLRYFTFHIIEEYNILLSNDHLYIIFNKITGR